MSALLQPINSAPDCLQVNKQKLAAAFSRRASAYQQHAQVQRTIADELCRRVIDRQATEYALDLGCGTGYLGRNLARGQDVWASVDIAFNMLGEAKQQRELSGDKHRQVFLQADAEALPFAAAEFDLVVSSMALQWVAEPRRCMAEIARVLCVGGRAHLAILRHDSLAELHQGWQRLGQSFRVNQFAPRAQWLSAMQQSSLTVQSVTQQGFVTHHPTLLALLHSINGIGAGTTAEAGKRALRKSDLHQLQRWWKQSHSDSFGLRLSYLVDFYQLVKL